MSDKPTSESHPHRSLHVAETPMDPAQQSLADALRTSFRILKFGIVVLVILFFASGSFVVEQNEQAIVLRLGQPTGEIRQAGFYLAFPEPIDEIVKIPVKQSTTLDIDSHWLHLRAEEQGLPLSSIQRRGGLHPARDGALLTADRGLVHVRWKVVYRIDDMKRYVSNVADAFAGKPEVVIKKILENAAIHVAAGFSTEDVTRKRLSDLRDLVRVRINDELDRLQAGIAVEAVEIPESTPPIQTRASFDRVIKAENRKRTAIREAEKKATETLNQVAGAVHGRLIELLDDLEKAEIDKDESEVVRIESEIAEIIEFEASGASGSMIRGSKGYYTSVVQGMRADLEEYRSLLDEFLTQPELLRTRLWEQAKARLFASAGVTKMYRSPGTQVRVQFSPDPNRLHATTAGPLLSGGGGHQHSTHLITGGELE